jgi:hypothetical protein
MSLSFAQKASVRRYLGYSLLYSQTDPVLEGQFQALDNLPDAGATEALVIQYITALDAIFAGMDTFQPVAELGAADDAKQIDVYRGLITRIRRGKQYVQVLSQALNMPVRADCFGVPKYDPSAGAFPGMRQTAS